jgi:hypothetical protein
MQINIKNKKITEFTDNGNCFLYYNQNLINLALPKLNEGIDCFMSNNQPLTNLIIPTLVTVGITFLRNHPKSDKFKPNN